jgi:diacylglycerol kinase (ATP)
LRARIHGLSPDAMVRETASPGDARRFAEAGVQEGCSIVVAAGGDGTLNEVVNGIAGSETALGILPVGTMNVFAKEMGIPHGNIEKAWGVIKSGNVRSFDLPRAGDKHFMQLAGVGLDAEVVRRTSYDSKRSLGPLSYLLTLAQVAAVIPPRVRVVTPSGIECEGSFLLIGNGRLYGGPFPLFKRARLDDGLLDVVVFQNQSHWDVVRYFQAIAFGKHPELPDVEYFQTPSLKVTSDGDVPVELDGEVAGVLPREFQMSPYKLRVLTPLQAQGNRDA